MQRINKILLALLISIPITVILFQNGIHFRPWGLACKNTGRGTRAQSQVGEPVTLKAEEVPIFVLQLTVQELADKPAPFTVAQTVELVSSLYTALGPRIGSHLVEPNALLTLAGFRGRGYFVIHDLTPEEQSRIEQVNHQLKDLGIEFDANDELFEDELVITNLKGWEYSTGFSKLPFIKKFNASTMNYSEWWQNTNEAAKKYFQSSAARGPFYEQGLKRFMIGLGFGYPDQALLDFYDAFRREGHPFEFSEIPFSNYYYSDDKPMFSFLPEHKDDPDVLSTIKVWGAFLKDFYASLWHQKHEKDPEFIQMRKLEEEHDKRVQYLRRNR